MTTFHAPSWALTEDWFRWCKVQVLAELAEVLERLRGAENNFLKTRGYLFVKLVLLLWRKGSSSFSLRLHGKRALKRPMKESRTIYSNRSHQNKLT